MLIHAGLLYRSGEHKTCLRYVSLVVCWCKVCEGMTGAKSFHAAALVLAGLGLRSRPLRLFLVWKP